MARPCFHILFVTPAFPPFPGGGERYAKALAAHFAARGNQVTVVTSTAQKETDFWLGRSRFQNSENSAPNLRLIRCPLRSMPGGRKGLLLWRKAMVLISALPGSQASILRRMARYIPPIVSMPATLSSLGASFDIVHGFNISWEYALLEARAFATAHSLPFVITPFAHLGASESDRVALNSTMDHQRWLMASADALVTLTTVEAEELRDHGVKPERVAVVGAGLDPMPSPGSSKEVARQFNLAQPFVMFVGRASYEKGAIHAAQAVLNIAHQGTTLNLAVVGQTTDEFDRFYQKLTPAEQQIVRPLGMLDESQKHALLGETAALLLPSRTDSFGIVLLEAWAHSKPVIGANAGGIPGVIDDQKNGLLVNFGDVPALMDAIHLLLGDKALNQLMGDNGRQKVSTNYNWEHLADKMLGVYEDLLRQ